MLDTLPLCKSLGLPSAEKNTEQSKPNAPGPPDCSRTEWATTLKSERTACCSSRLRGFRRAAAGEGVGAAARHQRDSHAFC